MILRVLLVDSSSDHLERLSRLLADHAGLEIVGTCTHRAAAARALRDLEPDVVFLDAVLPEGDGYAALDAVPPASRPVIIAMSEDGDRALGAFDAGAIDYVVKPISPERLAATLVRVRRQLRSPGERPAAAPRTELKRVLVRENSRTVVLPAERIDWMESANNYIVIHAGRDSHVLRETLTTLEQRLSPRQFLRISRFAIVNLDRIRELRPTPSGSHVAVMTDGIEVPLTRGIREVQEHLQFA